MSDMNAQRPPAGKTEGRSRIDRISGKHTPMGYRTGTGARLELYRDRVRPSASQECPRCVIEREHEATTWWLNSDLRLVSFDEAVAALLISPESLAVPA